MTRDQAIILVEDMAIALLDWENFPNKPSYREDYYRKREVVIAALAAQPRPFSGCLRDGVCRGVCRNTDCPNYDLVVVKGVVYPNEPVWDATSSDLDIEPIEQTMPEDLSDGLPHLNRNE